MANKEKIKLEKKIRRKGRVRVKISGTAKKPRLNVFRSLKHIFVQLIDDQKSVTVVSVKDSEISAKGGSASGGKESKVKKTDIAFKVGELVAVKAKEKGITEIVFDKSSNKYHGRIKAVAEGARKGGLIF
jgi:large subunit ribosomal protein L18|tara:strand:- start:17689 stop:18078 length:390 start_codon:yes stop_codon:yes gene_type:complete